MKNKYNDNRLAEEFDLIVLTAEGHEKNGLHVGDLGTLTYSYTGKERPLYAEFAAADGSRVEEALSLRDFRVLDLKNPQDLPLVTAYLKSRAAFHKAAL